MIKCNTFYIIHHTSAVQFQIIGCSRELQILTFLFSRTLNLTYVLENFKSFNNIFK